MNTKNKTTETTKSLNDLKNEKIDGTNVLGGGAGNTTMDIRLDGNGSGTKNSASEISGKPELL